MFPHLDERPSDHPLVDRVWRTFAEEFGAFTSMATTSWSLVVAKADDRVSISFHGPKTEAVREQFPAGAEWFGISFRRGAFSPALLPGTLLDKFVALPGESRRFFSWEHSRWEFPTFENAEGFVSRLMSAGLLERDPFIAEASGLFLSPRAAQYRFQRATGLSHRTIGQIDRARHAAALLQKGTPILDTVFEAGYSDQPHLTRSLRHFIGHTPAQIPSVPLVSLNPSSNCVFVQDRPWEAGLGFLQRSRRKG